MVRAVEHLSRPLARVHPLDQRLHEAAECASRQREETFWTFHQRFIMTQTLKEIIGGGG
jgi:hypothetical protein